MAVKSKGKVATPTAKTVAKAPAKAVKPKNEIAKGSDADEMSDEDIAALAQSAAEREQNSRAVSGSNATFISIAQDGATALKKKDKNFIEGLNAKDFYVQSKKLVLGDELKVVPLAIVEVYNEMTDEKKPRFLGVWLKEDAEKYDLAVGDYYKRELPNGNMLHPCTWFLVYVPEHPELERCVITFKSTARKVATAWRKDIDARGGNPAQLEYILTAEDTSNANGEWYQVGFEFSREIFSIEDGKYSAKVKYARDAILLQDAYTKAYAAGTIVKKRSDRVALEDNSEDAEGLEGDGDGDSGTF